MTGIAPTDHILLLLREQLKAAERGKANKSDKAGRAARPDQRARLAALAAVGALPERDFRRAMVRGLLAERLGEELVADPAFEAAALEVARIIEDSPETQALLDRAAAALRRPG